MRTRACVFAFDLSGERRHEHADIAQGKRAYSRLLAYLGSGHFRDLSYYYDEYDRTTSHVLHDWRDGRLAWAQSFPRGSFLSYADARAGASYLLWRADEDARRTRLYRIESDGSVPWCVAGQGAETEGLIVDRDDVVHFLGERGLVGLSPEGKRVLELDEPGAPIALDAWGKLLVSCGGSGRPRELLLVG